MIITLGGKPYTISKLKGEAAERWQEAFRLWRQTVGCPPDEVAALLLAVRPCFIPALAKWLPNYDLSLPWHEARPNELVTALLAIAHLNNPQTRRDHHGN